MRKSNSYVTTLDVNSATDMNTLEIIKATIQAVNSYNKNKKRVVLRGRKPTTGYTWGGSVIGGIKFATKLDVYIYDRH